MGRRALEEALLGLREGRVSLQEFFVVATPDLRRMADTMFRRWVIPPSVSAEDVFQEMCVSICAERRDLDWIPETRTKKGRLIDIVTHVLYHAHVAAKRWIHDQRKAKRRSGKNPSRFPICMAVLSERNAKADDDGDEFEVIAGAIEGMQEELTIAKDSFLRAYDDMPEPIAVAWAVYVQQGSEEAAAEMIDSSVGLAITCQTSTEQEALEKVRVAVKQGRQKMQKMSAVIAA